LYTAAKSSKAGLAVVVLISIEIAFHGFNWSSFVNFTAALKNADEEQLGS
jgi:hypothetical protein